MTTSQPKTQINLGAVRYGYKPPQTLRRKRAAKRAAFVVIVMILAAIASALIHAHNASGQMIGEPYAECAIGAACYHLFLSAVMR